MNRAQASEEEYFRNEEAEKRAEEAHTSARDAERASQAARARDAALDVRRCPQCRTLLGAHSVRGVALQRCLSCDGVWLEAGKLELLTRPGPGLLTRLLGFFSGRRSAPPR
jgi:Transcription factor zinc-finger